MKQRIPIIILITLIMGLLSSGCKEWPIKFSHKNHLKQGVECESCHVLKPGYELPTMPDMATCTTCHDVDKEAGLKEIKEHKTVPAECGKCHIGIPGEKKIEWAKWCEFPDVRFSHENHYKERKIDCKICHEDIDKVDRVTPLQAPRMETCAGCHEKDKTEIVCQQCHSNKAKETKPQDHLVGWQKRHGELIREGIDPRGEAKCYRCHRKDSCVDCHQNEPPSDHTNHWRQRGHGIASDIDRDRCATCHQMDECVRCHEQTAPRNHTAGWSGSSQRHCSVCHWPINAVGCWTCHKGTPGHDTASNRPGGSAHASGSDCRACHMPGAGLPHPDDGGSCERCHR